jgi:hypothetical protein
MKNFPFTVSGASMSLASYTQYLLNNISQGTGATNRTGRRTLNERMRVSFTWNICQNVTNSNPLDGYRVIIAYDKECRGSNFGLADLLTTSTFGEPAFNSSFLEDNRDRFVVLLDKQHYGCNLFSLTNNTVFGGVHHWVTEIQLPKNTHYYNTNVGTIADIDSGSIYAFVFGVTGSNSATYSLDCQLWFRDV